MKRTPVGENKSGGIKRILDGGEKIDNDGNSRIEKVMVAKIKLGADA